MVEVERPLLDNLQVPDEMAALGKIAYNYNGGTWYDDVSGSAANHVTEVKRGPIPAKPTTSDECFYGPVAMEPKQPHEATVATPDTYQPVLSMIDAAPWHLEVETSQAEVTVPTDKVGLIIGRRGRTIRSLQERTRTRMQIIQGAEQEDPAAYVPHKTLVITGSSDAVVEAENLVLDLIAKAPPLVPLPDDMEIPSKNEDSMSNSASQGDHPYYDIARSTSSHSNGGGIIQATRFPVPKTAVGLIIGKRGDTIRKIRRDTGAKVQFNALTGSAGDEGEQIATVVGRPDQIRHAVDLINELVDTAMKTAHPNDLTEGMKRKNFTRHFISPPDSDSDYDDQYVSPGTKTGLTMDEGSHCLRPRVLEDHFGRYDNEGYACQEEMERSSHFHRPNPRDRFKARDSYSNYAKEHNVEQGKVYPQPHGNFYSGQEYVQGDSSAQWNPGWTTQPQYFHTIPMGNSDYYMNIPAHFSGDYSNWVQYFPSAPHAYPAPLPTMAVSAPHVTNPDQPPERTAPVPLMTATIVQGSDHPTSCTVGPAKVYFNIPNFQPTGQHQQSFPTVPAEKQSPQCAMPTHVPEPEPADGKPEPAYSNSEQMKNEPNKEDIAAESKPKLSGSVVIEESEKTELADVAHHQVVTNDNNTTQNDSALNPVVLSNGSSPHVGRAGSSTRTVSFYYDLNANSIVIMNQWHVY